MKFFALLFGVAFLAVANGKLANEQQHGKTSMATKPAIKPTAAPLMTSTSAPTKAPKAQVSPTKSVTMKTEKTTMDKEMSMDTLPIKMPATVDHPLQAEESKPMAVTGFITKNGNIYEIQDKNGIGQIQSRQVDDEGQHVCNYGSVVIYSDVPCEQVTNVKITEVEDKPALDQAAPVQQMQPVNKPAENNDNKPSEDKEDLDAQKKKDRRRRRRPSNKRPNNKNKTSNLKKQKRPNNTNNNNNSQRLQQKRRRQQQQQQELNRRRWEQEEDYDEDDDRQYQYNRHRWQQEEEDDDDDERQFENQRRRKQQKAKKRKQAQRYTSDYYDY